MTTMFWKAGALLSAIGVGSAVVYQAQMGLQQAGGPSATSPEDFAELDLSAGAAGAGGVPGGDDDGAFTATVDDSSAADFAPDVNQADHSAPFDWAAHAAAASATTSGDVGSASAAAQLDDRDPANWELGDDAALDALAAASLPEARDDRDGDSAVVSLDDSLDSEESLTSDDAAGPALRSFGAEASGPVLMSTPAAEEFSNDAAHDNPDVEAGASELALVDPSANPFERFRTRAPRPARSGGAADASSTQDSEAGKDAAGDSSRRDSSAGADVDAAASILRELGETETEATPDGAIIEGGDPFSGAAAPSVDEAAADDELLSVPQRARPPRTRMAAPPTEAADPGAAGFLAPPASPATPDVSPTLAPEEDAPGALTIPDLDFDDELETTEIPYEPGPIVTPGEPSRRGSQSTRSPSPAAPEAPEDDEDEPILRASGVDPSRSTVPGHASEPPSDAPAPGAPSTIPSAPATGSSAAPRRLPELPGDAFSDRRVDIPVFGAPPEDDSEPLNLDESSTTASPPPARRGVDLVGDGVIDRDIGMGPAQPQLTITKEAPSEAVIDVPMVYAIIVRNVGRSTAHDVVVKDKIPRGAECTGTVPQCESANKELIWSLGAMPPGDEKKLLVRVTPKSAGEIGSIATVSFSAEVAARTIIAEPQAGLNVEGEDEAVVGDAVRRQYMVTNTGPVDLQGAWLRVKLPSGLAHEGGNDLEYELGSLPKGQSRVVQLTMQAVEAGAFTSACSLMVNDRELASTTTPVDIVDSRLAVERTGPVRRFIGATAAYTNRVINQSKRPLANVQVTETLPAGVDLAGPPANGRWDAARRTLTWTIAELAPGASVELPVSVVPRAAGQLAWLVSAADSTGNRAEVESALEVAGLSSLTVGVAHNGSPIPVGEQVSLRFTVVNRGTGQAESIQPEFELPEEVEFISAEGPARFERTGRIIHFEPVASLAADERLEYDLMFTATRATPPGSDTRITVRLYSADLPEDRPIEQQQQLVIFATDEATETVLQTSGKKPARSSGSTVPQRATR